MITGRIMGGLREPCFLRGVYSVYFKVEQVKSSLIKGMACARKVLYLGSRLGFAHAGIDWGACHTIKVCSKSTALNFPYSMTCFSSGSRIR